ncbi:nuclease-related domain-containing protein [Flavobacterium reichenbachii]|uniref:NERD domain-containing protein n=1 Tax=Flavobacterium reichenbachii TaxID=362418 RepID=A0A085ZMV6_9FLAO|nr:nuclease-related domain-containing protein [Flavobacterium reichenbachii]KFF05770.1 hypothetical protein IW19_09665 [Flavobacterium reichenbachii]OXB12659.1 hypothetical protein B0A68_17875 [Flavobacterium reichenbachii]
MCRVYNTIGCLNTIQFKLVKNDIDDFNSLDELISFKKNYDNNEQKIISDHNLIIQEEKIFLENEISELDILIQKRIAELRKKLRENLDQLNLQIENLPETNSKIIPTIKEYWTNLLICLRFWFLQIISSFRITLFKFQAKKLLSKKKKRLKYISTNFQNAVYKSSFKDLKKFEIKKETIENLNNTIYGAIGEQKVEDLLKKLPENYTLINDFCYTFEKPLNHNGDYIKSIQIDHLLISPSGIFLIETKNWSTHSINNTNLRSPVQQILRTNFALFRILADKTSKSSWNFARQHWGNRKIPIKNIVVFTNNVPRE